MDSGRIGVRKENVELPIRNTNPATILKNTVTLFIDV